MACSFLIEIWLVTSSQWLVSWSKIWSDKLKTWCGLVSKYLNHVDWYHIVTDISNSHGLRNGLTVVLGFFHGEINLWRSLSYLLPLAEASRRTGQVLPKTSLLFCRPLVPKDNNNKETEQNRNLTSHQNFNILCIFIFSAKHKVKSLLAEHKKTEELAAHD